MCWCVEKYYVRLEQFVDKMDHIIFLGITDVWRSECTLDINGVMHE